IAVMVIDNQGGHEAGPLVVPVGEAVGRETNGVKALTITLDGHREETQLAVADSGDEVTRRACGVGVREGEERSTGTEGAVDGRGRQLVDEQRGRRGAECSGRGLEGVGPLVLHRVAVLRVFVVGKVADLAALDATGTEGDPTRGADRVGDGL